MDGVLENPLESESLVDVFLSILEAIVTIGAIFLVIALVFVGFQFVAAQGAEEKLRKARMSLVWTIIGGAILLGAQIIVIIIRSTVGSI